MKRHIARVALLFLLVIGVAAAVPHFALDRSMPEAGSTVESPSEIRLWFTQEPQEGTTQIRLVEAEDAGVHVMDVAQDEEDPKAFYIVVHGELPAGEYNVSWRGMGVDGHVIRDAFSFSVGAK